METVLEIAGSVGVAIGIVIAMALQSRKNKKLALALEPTLREKGPMTLPALSETLGMANFYARGKVGLALNELVSQRLVEVIPAPEGTPQLQKVKFIQYKLRT